MKIYHYPQLSPEWYQAHVGKVTGSCADDMLAVSKKGGGDLEPRKKLRRRLVAEHLTAVYEDTLGPFLPAAMQRGRDLEPMAFAAYEGLTGQGVRRVGFVEHDSLAAGCSPDGVVGEWEGLIELKCPKSTTHVEYWQGGVVPADYMPQVMHNLFVTGAQWCDFVSFDDRFPLDFQLFRVRVERSSVDLADYEAKLRAFLGEVDRALVDLLASSPVPDFVVL